MGALEAGCERAREWVSLGLDDELSEHEHAQLRAHLARCPACAPYAREIDVVTMKLRATGLERPTRSFRLPRRRSHPFALRTATGLAAVAASAGLAVLGGSLPAGAPPSPSAHGAVAQPPYFERQLLRLARHAHGGMVDVS
jgi:anti-sigma factor RsiW